MIFGKIDYLNLLPFNVFIKRHMRSLRLHSSIHYKKGTPSQINSAFKRRKVDAAFISSIESKKYHCLDLGIVAQKEVMSVLVLPGIDKPDSASATSNVLAKQLNLQGEVIIGDRALKHYLKTKEGIDLAQVWYDKHKLPFVFARLCSHKRRCSLNKLAKKFKSDHVKIPYYLIKKASVESDISIQDIHHYLTKISYSLSYKEKKSLKKFLYP